MLATVPDCKKSNLAGILAKQNRGNAFQMTPLRIPATNSFKPTLFFVTLALILLTTSVSRAQETDDVVRTTVSLVQLNVGVVDQDGRAITSLTRNDFAVFEDGVRQSISQFEPTNAPFSLVLLLDVSGSTINFRPQLKAGHPTLP